ncbi:MAG: RNA polymerase sigma factor [Actinomycetota bacterium]
MAAPAATHRRSATQRGGSGASPALDDEEFEAIYREHRPTLVRFAARQNADDPEAAADHALFELYRAGDRLRTRQDAAVRAYLFRATSTQIIDQHRRLSRSVTADEAAVDVHPDPAGDIGDRVVDAALVQKLIQDLPPAQRETIIQRFFLGLSAEEAGHLQGRQANAIHQLQHRAMANLRTALLAGLAVVIAALVVWLARGVVLDQPVETDPIERGSDTIDDVPPVIGGTETDRAAGVTADDTGVPPTGNADGTTSTPPLVEQPGDGSSPSTTTVATDPVDLGADDDPAPTTTGVVPATIGFNRCTMLAVGSDRIVITLFDPGVDVSRAADYVAPSGIRFVDDDGDTVFEIETDGAGVDGTAGGSAGWIEFTDGVRTWRSYADASSPAGWGVLLDNAIPDNWTTVEYLDALGRWVAAPVCTV